jgi:hypothetical protein
LFPVLVASGLASQVSAPRPVEVPESLVPARRPEVRREPAPKRSLQAKAPMPPSPPTSAIQKRTIPFSSF